MICKQWEPKETQKLKIIKGRILTLYYNLLSSQRRWSWGLVDFDPDLVLLRTVATDDDGDRDDLVEFREEDQATLELVNCGWMSGTQIPNTLPNKG